MCLGVGLSLLFHTFFFITCQVLQRKTEKASMPTKSCIDCREKDLEIRDKDSEIRELKENVMKLEMEKVEVIHLLVSALLSVIHAFYGSSNLAMSNICLLWLSVIILIIFFFSILLCNRVPRRK